MTIVAHAPARPWPCQACPTRAAEDALLLLATGRTDMARAVLEGLPALVREALVSAAAERARATADAELVRLRVEACDLEARLARARRELADLKASLGVARKAAAKPLAKPHERLATALADGRTTAERVAELLKAEPRHVYEVASGRVRLAPLAWKKLFAELEVSIP
jgi:hypothetical protein